MSAANSTVSQFYLAAPTYFVVETAAAAELAPRHAAGYLDGPVVRLHLRSFLAALQALHATEKQKKA